MKYKTILITGCSSGIGYAVAHELHVKGYRVFATARKSEDVAHLRNEGLEALQLDVTDEASMDTALAEVLNRTGGTLDVLFNNAGFGQPGALEDVPPQALREQFETNVIGLHTLTCKVLPIMRAQGAGRIIHNSSILGFIPWYMRGAYVASKYAVEGLADTLRLELAGTNISVSLIEPGPITSRFRANAYEKFKAHIDIKNSNYSALYEEAIQRFEGHGGKDDFELPPSAVTKRILHVVMQSKRPKARYYVTTPTYVMGYLKRLLPTRWFDKVLLKLSA